MQSNQRPQTQVEYALSQINSTKKRSEEDFCIANEWMHKFKSKHDFTTYFSEHRKSTTLSLTYAVV